MYRVSINQEFIALHQVPAPFSIVGTSLQLCQHAFRFLRWLLSCEELRMLQPEESSRRSVSAAAVSSRSVSSHGRAAPFVAPPPPVGSPGRVALHGAGGAGAETSRFASADGLTACASPREAILRASTRWTQGEQGVSRVGESIALRAKFAEVVSGRVRKDASGGEVDVVAEASLCAAQPEEHMARKAYADKLQLKSKRDGVEHALMARVELRLDKLLAAQASGQQQLLDLMHAQENTTSLMHDLQRRLQGADLAHTLDPTVS